MFLRAVKNIRRCRILTAVKENADRFFHNVALEQSVTEIDFHLVSSHENRDILTDGIADFK